MRVQNTTELARDDARAHPELGADRVSASEPVPGQQARILEVIDQDEVVGEEGEEETDHGDWPSAVPPEQVGAGRYEGQLDQDEEYRMISDQIAQQEICLVREPGMHPHECEERVQSVEGEDRLRDAGQPADLLGG